MTQPADANESFGTRRNDVTSVFRLANWLVHETAK
jgi:hypothetical protein